MSISFISDIQEYVVPLLVGLSRDGNGGLSLNLKLTLLTIPISFLVGVIVGIVRLNTFFITRYLAIGYIELAKSIPLVLGIFWFYYILPILFNTEFTLFQSAMIALVFFGGAYFAEAIRSGANTINREEIYSARLSGLSRLVIIRLIVLPQTLSLMLPALFSITIGLFKDTATVYVIGIVELTQSSMAIANRYPDKLVSIYILVGLFYFAVCSSLSLLAKYYEGRHGARTY